MGDDSAAVRDKAMTAYARAEDRKQAFDAGFDVHLPKPVDINELLGIVERLGRLVSGDPQ